MHCQESGRYFFTLFARFLQKGIERSEQGFQRLCRGAEQAVCPLVAAVVSAAMAAAGVAALAVRFIVVSAVHIGVMAQLARQQGQHGCIGIAADTAVKADAGLRQGSLRATADAAADQRVNAVLL